MQAILLDRGVNSARMGRPSTKPRGAFGQRLLALRQAAGLSQRQLASRLGVDQSNIAFWERWDKPPRGEVLPALAKALSVSVDELLGLAKPKRETPPSGKARHLFEAVSKLPRRQQQRILDTVQDMLVARSINGRNHST